MISIFDELPAFHQPNVQDSGIRKDVLMTNPVWLLDQNHGWLVGIGFKTGNYAWWEFLEKHGKAPIKEGFITHWKPIPQPDGNNEELYDAAIAAVRAVIFDESIDNDLASDVFDGLTDDLEDMRRERFGEGE